MTEDEIDRCEFWVTAYHKVRASKKCNAKGERIQVNFNWNFEYLENKLQEYTDREVIDYFNYGWPLNAENTETREEIPRNQARARANVDKIKQYIRNELENGSIIGPFHSNPFGEKARFSPLNTRPKRTAASCESSSTCLIHSNRGHSMLALAKTVSWVSPSNSSTPPQMTWLK